MNKWISVKDGLPEQYIYTIYNKKYHSGHTRKVWCFSSSGGVDLGYYNFENECWYDAWGSYGDDGCPRDDDIDDVTHWMLIGYPEPPRESEGSGMTLTEVKQKYFPNRSFDELEGREKGTNKKHCICVDFHNNNPDAIPNPDCPIHGGLHPRGEG